MRLGSIVAALALLGGMPANAGSNGDLAERLSMEQTLRLATLSPARISEMRCAGFGQWLAINRPGGKNSPTSAAADRLSAEVQAAIANDAELPADLVHELVASLSAEAKAKIADEGETAFARDVEACAPLYAAAAQPEPLKLHPLARPSVVSPALASCYAQYRLAAAVSSPEQAGDLNANAEKARQLALKGKEGAARAAAEAALESELRATKATPQADREAGMMRLIMCQPLMATAAGGDAQ
jgi:hypothetical protein